MVCRWIKRDAGFVRAYAASVGVYSIFFFSFFFSFFSFFFGKKKADIPSLALYKTRNLKKARKSLARGFVMERSADAIKWRFGFGKVRYFLYSLVTFLDKDIRVSEQTKSSQFKSNSFRVNVETSKGVSSMQIFQGVDSPSNLYLYQLTTTGVVPRGLYCCWEKRSCRAFWGVEKGGNLCPAPPPVFWATST